MMLASADIETTGLSAEDHMILEVGVVLWDTTDFTTPVESLPTFHCYVTRERSIVGDPFALSMHPTILRRIANRDIGFLYVDASQVAFTLNAFMKANAPESIDANGRAKMAFAGKNFGTFDLQFLKQLSNWGAFIRAQHRVIDVGPLYFDPATDAVVPSIDECVKRACKRTLVPLEPTTHTAVEDARLVIELLRAIWQPTRCRNVIRSYRLASHATAVLTFEESVSNVASELEINLGGSSNRRFRLMPVGEGNGYALTVEPGLDVSLFVGRPVFIHEGAHD